VVVAVCAARVAASDVIATADRVILVARISDPHWYNTGWLVNADTAAIPKSSPVAAKVDVPTAPTVRVPFSGLPTMRLAGRTCKISDGTVKVAEPAGATQINLALEFVGKSVLVPVISTICPAVAPLQVIASGWFRFTVEI